MNRLSRKFLCGMAVILTLVILACIVINTCFVERYYIHQKKQDIDGICSRLTEGIAWGMDSKAVLEELEKTEEVVIVELSKDTDMDRLNESLRSKLQEKGIGFHKFWLWDQDYQSTLKNGRQLRIYNQEKLNYSIMTEYMQENDRIFAVAMIIPDISEAIRMINRFTVVIMAAALLVASIFLMILVRRITKPLDRMRRQAEDMANQKFYTIEVHTNDELSLVAESMNQMGERIREYQNELEEKNRQMERLMDDVAHELKTPIALIKAYAGGLDEGLDDGTFLDTIRRKNDLMGEIVEKLLTLSRIDQKAPDVKTVRLDEMIGLMVEEQAVLLQVEEAQEFRADITTPAAIVANSEVIGLILSNLISNAVKYSAGTCITVSLKPVGEGFEFAVSNFVGREPDLSQIWNPFYVGEESRNKNLSGTGLGLAIVRKTCEYWGYEAAVGIQDGVITFRVRFHDKEEGKV